MGLLALNLALQSSICTNLELADIYKVTSCNRKLFNDRNDLIDSTLKKCTTFSQERERDLQKSLARMTRFSDIKETGKLVGKHLREIKLDRQNPITKLMLLKGLRPRADRIVLKSLDCSKEMIKKIVDNLSKIQALRMVNCTGITRDGLSCLTSTQLREFVSIGPHLLPPDALEVLPRSLEVLQCKFEGPNGDDQLGKMERFSKLRKLVFEASCTGKTLDRLPTTLEVLELTLDKLTDENVGKLHRLHNLKILEMSGNIRYLGVQGSTLGELPISIKHLSLRNQARLESLKVRHLINLTYLDIAYTHAGNDLSKVDFAPSLRVLKASMTYLTDSIFDMLKPLSGLRELDISNNGYDLTGNKLYLLPLSLRSLVMHGTNVREADLISLRRLKLTKLTIGSDSGYTGDSFPSFPTSLEEITLHGGIGNLGRINFSRLAQNLPKLSHLTKLLKFECIGRGDNMDQSFTMCRKAEEEISKLLVNLKI